MKTTSSPSRRAGLCTLGLLAAFTGCTSVPTRNATSDTPYPDKFLSLAASGVVLPSPDRTVVPDYPYAMRRSGITGQVDVRCTVDATGRVLTAEALDYTNRAFVDPALEAMRRWTFKPAMQDGEPVASRVRIPVLFSFVE